MLWVRRAALNRACALTRMELDGYEFLMQNCTYQDKPALMLRADLIAPIISDTANDRICIFGFSRGAYTARRYVFFSSLTFVCELIFLEVWRECSTRCVRPVVIRISWPTGNLFRLAFCLPATTRFVETTLHSSPLNSPQQIPFAYKARASPIETSSVYLHNVLQDVHYDRRDWMETVQRV
jgi:hypothetical protein